MSSCSWHIQTQALILNARNNSGDGAAMIAYQYGHQAIFQMLIEVTFIPARVYVYTPTYSPIGQDSQVIYLARKFKHL